MICASLFLINSCSTPKNNLSLTEKPAENIIVKPKEIIKPAKVNSIIKETVINWDENEQNGGIISFSEDLGWQITQKALDKYNYLIKKYGKDEFPALSINHGVSFINDKIYLSQEYMIKFAFLNLKNKGALND